MDRGLNLVIDTDSHHTRDLVRMDYGVSYAQRAWVTADRVVNTWEPERLVGWVRSRRG